MSQNGLPKCFISYCHENADFLAIEALQNDLQSACEGLFEVIRDKPNLPLGGSVSVHEKQLQKSHIIIILFTPEYKNKIKNRIPGGAFREYSTILDRYKEHDELIKDDKKARPFLFLPILFAGTKDSSIPEEISDAIWEDLTSYRVVLRQGKYIVPDYVRKNFEAFFEKFSAQCRNLSAAIDNSYRSEYDTMLDLLFVTDKHEALRTSGRLHEREKILRELFVKTKSYKSIAKGTKCILVGRKGSGKSTIVDHFYHEYGTNQKPPININVDSFNLLYLFNFIESSPYASDVRDLITEEKFFELSWKCYIIQQCAYILLDEQKKGRTTPQVSRFMGELSNFFTAARRKKQPWAQFMDVCTRVKKAMDSAIEQIAPDDDFFAELADRLDVETIIRDVIPGQVLDAFSEAVKNCSRNFVFSLDGFDQKFEDFRRKNLQSNLPEQEAQRRINFEIVWLKGLLRAVLDFRSGDCYVQDKIDFCITVPQDRYLEVRQQERDDYRFRNLATHMQWSGFELAILIRKRLEQLIRVDTKKAPPLESLNSMLKKDAIGLPLDIEMRIGKNIVSIPLFSYILRHTFWRPRDLMFYFAAILATKNWVAKHGQNINQALIKEIVSRKTIDIINSEFINEYQNNITNIREIIRRFSECKIIMSFSEFEGLIKGLSFKVDGGLTLVNDAIQKLDLLYDIGFLGIETAPSQRRSLNASRESGPKEIFVFSDGRRAYETINEERKRKSNIVIHPIFSEYLHLDTEVDRVILLYTENYLRQNDQLEMT